MITTIIFDLEGVVIDTERLWDQEISTVLSRRDISYDREKIKHLLSGRSVSEASGMLIEMFGLECAREELTRERIEIMKKLIQDNARLINGFSDFYETIRPKYKTCIATSMDHELLKLTESKIGLNRLFSGKVFSIADVGNIAKPNPDLFLFSAEKLMSAPDECVVIEDSPLGITAAKRAGMKSMGITTTYRRNLLNDADIVVDSYSEIDPERFPDLI
ncbi:HAD family phosphatase [Candidatus Woesearchaeota archaeon]|nr:HAD family phosphatase [Candidatus Woesearchaeota archaeon]